jgi:hypothetical protein
MRKLTFIIAIACAAKSYGNIYYGYSTLKGYAQSGPDITVANMPPVRSQDTLGICYSFAAGALLEHSICNDGEKKLNCQSLSDDQRPSVVDLSKYACNPETSKSTDKDENNSKTFSKSIHDTMTYGLDVLTNLFNTKKVAKESCAPFDQLVAKARDSSQQTYTEAAIWKQFKMNYDNFHAKLKECADCNVKEATTTADDMIKKLDLKTSNTEILQAFAAESYNEFLYKALVPERCGRAAGQLPLFLADKKVVSWPPQSNSMSYEDTITKLKDVLSNQRPIMVNRFCTKEVPTVECIEHSTNGIEQGGHAFVITGYRKMCKPGGLECRESLKVHNSWGQTWQDQNDGGWVDAKTLVKQTMNLHNSYAWIEKK